MGGRHVDGPGRVAVVGAGRGGHDTRAPRGAGRDSGQCLGQLAGRGVPVGRVDGHAAGQDVVDARRQVGPVAGHGRARRVEVLVGDVHVVRARERDPSGQALEGGAGEGVHVGGRAEGGTRHELLGRGVVGRGRHGAGGGEAEVGGLLHGPGDPEVAEVHVVGVGGAQHVGGLDVPVDEPAAVGAVERVRDLGDDGGGPGRAERAVAQRGPQIAAVDVAHHDVGDAGSVGVLGVDVLGGGVDRDDAGVVQPGGEAGLPQEALAGDVVDDHAVAVQHLDGDAPLEVRVPGREDAPVAALSDLGLDAVAGPGLADAGSASHGARLGGVAPVPWAALSRRGPRPRAARASSRGGRTRSAGASTPTRTGRAGCRRSARGPARPTCPGGWPSSPRR